MKSLNQLTTILFSALFSLATLLSAQAHAEADLYFIHSDHLGTPQAITDDEQNVVWKTQQTPFGEAAEETGTVVQPLRFPGQYADQESGLSYNYFRDYDPSLGRYVQSDPIGLDGGLNTYTYVNGNPILFIDPLGLYGTSSCDYYSRACQRSGGYACAAQRICPIFPEGEKNDWWQCVRQCLQEEHHRREESGDSCPVTDNPYTDHTTCFTACAVNSGNPGLPGAPPRP